MAHKFSLIFLDSSGCTIKQIRCSRKRLIGLSSLLCIAICAIAYIFFDYLILHKSISGKDALERDLALQTEEVLHQRKQIQQFAVEINDLKERLVKLDAIEKRIRIIANIDHSENGEGLLGVGGSAPEDLNPNIELTQRHQRLIKDMHSQIGQLNKATDNQNIDFKDLLKRLEAQKNLLAHTPAIRPVDGWITSGFGYRKSPFTNKKEFHKGIDFANRLGSEIVSPADGVVSFAGTRGFYGKLMIIDHGHGVTTRYAHLDKTLLKRGDRAIRGKTIALMGNTGRSTGPHLHFEVRLDGVPVNPSRYFMN